MNLEEKKTIEGPFNRALQLKREGRFDEAIDILLAIMALYPRFPAILGTLASTYRKKGDLANAALYFQRTVELSPKSELASLGLFHSLWETGQKDRAFAEITRFLSIAKSDEYEDILNKINAGLFESPGSFLVLRDPPPTN